MAKAPKCKTCGAQHWSTQPHVFAGPKQPLTPTREREAPVSLAETEELARLEAMIEPRLKDWMIVGEALSQIRDRQLYRREHRTFEAYCLNRWQISRSRAYQLVEAIPIVHNVDKLNLPRPSNEAVARALAPLKDDTVKLGVAWAETVEKHGPAPTAAQTAAVVTEYRPVGAPPKPEGHGSSFGFSDEEGKEEPAPEPDAELIQCDHLWELRAPAGEALALEDAFTWQDPLPPRVHLMCKRCHLGAWFELTISRVTADPT